MTGRVGGLGERQYLLEEGSSARFGTVETDIAGMRSTVGGLIGEIRGIKSQVDALSAEMHHH